MKRIIATVFAAAMLSVGGMGVASAAGPSSVPNPTPVTHTYKCGFPLGTFKVTAPQYLITQYDAKFAAYGCTHTP
ncbi:hypothetical protein ABT381_25770 [Streptomyces sp. NPDC000151]|uniref:hypothetical protein n=1 Tax=Streptomyces sp. NPDC000151 TaxID=3154244 RepID=UPI00332F2DEE